MSEPPLSPTERTTLTRGHNRRVDDRTDLHELLGDALIAHLGVVRDGCPVVLPVAYGVDLDGPDDGGTVYVHASVAAGWLAAASGSAVCLTVTELDGLVAARSAFHHSMNYRSAVVIGSARVVTDADERARALDLVIDHMVPGRAATLRPHTRKELAATAVLALPLAEASMKRRAESAVDEPEDVASGVWAGVIPVRRVADPPVTAPDASGLAPADVTRRAEALGAACDERR